MDRELYAGVDERGRPKDAIVKSGSSFASSHASGTGPFIVTEREQGVRLELKRFADYWDKASPGNVDEIVFTPIKEPATRVAALLAGDVDFIAPVPPTDLARVKEASCCTLITMPSTRVLTFELNQERVPAFKDPRVRLAMSYAVNREGIAEKILRATKIKGRTLVHDKTVDLKPGLFKRLLANAFEHIATAKETTYSHDVVIHGLRVRAITNSEHLHGYWKDNWYGVDEWQRITGQKPADSPDVLVVALGRVPSESEAAYYSRQNDTVIFFNTSYYGQLKSWVLGAVGRKLAVEYERPFGRPLLV